MSTNRPEEALALLNRLTDFANKENQLSSEVELLCLTAICRAQSGDYLKAIRALEQAFDIGEPKGYTRSFIDEGEPMAKLLSKYHVMSRSFEGLNHTAYAKRLLRLLAGKRSSEEIAASLIISVSAVKQYNCRI